MIVYKTVINNCKVQTSKVALRPFIMDTYPHCMESKNVFLSKILKKGLAMHL